MTSFYISRLNFYTTEMVVAELFSEFGQVDQVEFILPNTKENDDVKSALIHMSDLTQKGLDLIYCIANGEDYKIYVNAMEYLSISFAQNIDKCYYLEKKVEAQEKTIAELINRQNNTEKRIEELENVVKKLINDIFEPENSVSTHSSMPSLVDDNSVSTHSSMPSLVDDNSVSTHSSMPSLVDDDSEDENDDDNSTQSSLTWLEDDWSDSSIPPPLIDEYGNIIE